MGMALGFTRSGWNPTHYLWDETGKSEHLLQDHTIPALRVLSIEMTHKVHTCLERGGARQPAITAKGPADNQPAGVQASNPNVSLHNAVTLTKAKNPEGPQLINHLNYVCTVKIWTPDWVHSWLQVAQCLTR